MVMFMKKKHFVSILAALTLIVSMPIKPLQVSAIESTNQLSSISTTDPAPRSGGVNNNLTINLYPQRNTSWGPCSFASQRYCYEPATIVSADGKEVPSSATPASNCHNSGYSTELCAMDGSDWLEVGLSGSFSEATSQSVFRWKLRTGKLSPDILMMGDTQKTVIGGNATDGWTIEIWAKPAFKAYLDGCYSASSCPDTSVASYTYYSISGYLRMLGVNASWPSVATEALRNALRGTFITTNGMSQSWSFSMDTFSAKAVSPHLLPADSTGKSAITPGYVKIFLPETYLTLDRGYIDLSLVTSDRIKLTVSGAKATAKVTKVDGGIMVDTGVEHFSSVDITLEVFLKSASLSSAAAPTSNSVVAVNNSIAVVAQLKKGASKTLSSIVKTKASQKPKWSASGKCKIVGSKVVALKVGGTCKVILRVLNSKKKYVLHTVKTFKVS